MGGSDHVGQPLSEGSVPWLREFQLDGNTACWTFQFGELTLERRLVMPHQRNTTCLRYEIRRGPAALIRLRPFMPFRRQDAPLRQPGYGQFVVGLEEEGGCRIRLAGSELWMAMRVMPVGATFVPSTMEDADTWLWREEVRGYEFQEAVASPGYFEWFATPDAPAVLVLTTEESHPHADPDQPFSSERQRVDELVERGHAQRDPFLARLVVAADQFLILPENRLEESTDAARQGHALRTVVAGYHWFLDWGRDTMISLEGLMLATGREAEARATLLTFAHYLRDGLLPNLFPEGSREGWYHTVDATLWYFHAIHRYLVATRDQSLLRELLPALRGIMAHHIQGQI